MSISTGKEGLGPTLDFSGYRFEQQGGLEPPYHAQVVLVGPDDQRIVVVDGFSSWVTSALEASRLTRIKKEAKLQNGQKS